MAVLRRIAGISRWDRRRNVDIRRDLEINRDVVNHVRSRRLSYFEHVVRMSPSRIPNIMLYGRGMGRDQWADQRSAGSIMSETTAKSWVSLWRKLINWRGTGRGGGVVSQGCLNARTCLCRRSNKSSPHNFLDKFVVIVPYLKFHKNSLGRSVKSAGNVAGKLTGRGEDSLINSLTNPYK